MRTICAAWTFLIFVFPSSSTPPRLGCCDDRLNPPYKAEFEWWAHSRMAAEAGVAEDVIQAIRTETEPEFSTVEAAAVYHVAHALNHRHRLSDDEFAQARGTLGEQGLVDVIGLCGYYALVSLTLNAYEVPTPDDSAAFE